MEYHLIKDADDNANLHVIKKIEDDGTIKFVPDCEGNRDWDEYQSWLDLGNEPEAAE